MNQRTSKVSQERSCKRVHRTMACLLEVYVKETKTPTAYKHKCERWESGSRWSLPSYRLSMAASRVRWSHWPWISKSVCCFAASPAAVVVVVCTKLQIFCQWKLVWWCMLQNAFHEKYENDSWRTSPVLCPQLSLLILFKWWKSSLPLTAHKHTLLWRIFGFRRRNKVLIFDSELKFQINLD